MVGGNTRPNHKTGPHTDPLLILLLKAQTPLLGWTLLCTVLWLLAVVGMPKRYLVLLLSCESSSADLLAAFFDYSQYYVDSQTPEKALLTSVSLAKPSTHGPHPCEDFLCGVFLRLTFQARFSSWATGPAFGQALSETTEVGMQVPEWGPTIVL